MDLKGLLDALQNPGSWFAGVNSNNNISLMYNGDRSLGLKNETSQYFKRWLNVIPCLYRLYP